MGSTCSYELEETKYCLTDVIYTQTQSLLVIFVAYTHTVSGRSPWYIVLPEQQGKPVDLQRGGTVSQSAY